VHAVPLAHQSRASRKGCLIHRFAHCQVQWKSGFDLYVKSLCCDIFETSASDHGLRTLSVEPFAAQARRRAANVLSINLAGGG
jgi:hypothetical protein